MTKVTAKKKAKAAAKKTPALPKNTASAKKLASKNSASSSTAASKADSEPSVIKTAAKKTASKVTAKKTTSKKATAKKATGKKVAVGVKNSPKATSKAVAGKSAKKVAKKAPVSKVAAANKVAAKKPAVKKSATETTAADTVNSTAQKITLGEPPTPVVVPYERKKNSHYMDPEQLTHFSEKLAEWKQQLLVEVDRTVGHMKDDATNFPDPNDRATQEEEFSLELRTRDRERKLIKKINEAQKRIEENEYGYCETCGVEIGVGRLEARPTAELCIDCKTLEEIRERQIA